MSGELMKAVSRQILDVVVIWTGDIELEATAKLGSVQLHIIVDRDGVRIDSVKTPSSRKHLVALIHVVFNA